MTLEICYWDYYYYVFGYLVQWNGSCLMSDFVNLQKLVLTMVLNFADQVEMHQINSREPQHFVECSLLLLDRWLSLGSEIYSFSSFCSTVQRLIPPIGTYQIPPICRRIPKIKTWKKERDTRYHGSKQYSTHLNLILTLISTSERRVTLIKWIDDKII